jgi:flagellin
MSVINTNVKALSAQASMSNVNKSMETAMERLSTGIRINSAKDDAAGLAIALRMTADIRGTAVAIRNANDAISLSQTAEGGLGQINDILQRMRELAVQSSNATAAPDNRQASQLEISQLKQEIDTIANRTNFNGIKLLDGTAAKLSIQTGVNAGDMMTMNISAARTQDIGIGGRASLTATGHAGATGLAKQINAGDLIINGVTVGASTAADDGFSSSDKSSSAIAKVVAINAVSSQSGVIANVGKTTVSGSAQSAGAGSGTISINGVSTASITVSGDAGVSRTNVVNAINLIAGQTGVRAIDTGDLNKGVQLVADDGRNVVVAFSASTSGTWTAATTGIAAANVYTGSYQLTSVSGAPITLSSSSSGTIANAGVAAGTYQANVSTVTSVARASQNAAPSNTTTGVLDAGTMRVNGIAIDAAVSASDTASAVQATSSTKAASAIAIAAAINAKTSLTGVTAKAEPTTIVGTSFTATSTAKTININNVAISLATTDITVNAIASKINAVTGQTGVVATDNGRGMTLTAADGRNISVAAVLGASETLSTNVGLTSGVTASSDSTAATATLATTTYGNVTLNSDVAFTLEGGSDGNTNFALLGFKTGTVGGSNNGIKISAIDVGTQTGAQLAITALDAAMKAVSMNQAQLGAYQNRLESAISNLTEGSTNMNASRSRVLDTDYAKESTNLAKAQIITQAATAMLAQANQSAQSVLALLK